MERVLTFLNELLPCDKLKHSYFGNMVYLILLILSVVITSDVTISVIISVALTIVIAFGKELYDKRNYQTHTYDIYDALHTIMYPIIYSILILLIK